MALTDLLNLTLSTQDIKKTPDLTIESPTNKETSANSAFDEEPFDMKYASDEEIDAWYENWIADKNQYNIKTTKLRKNEVNFAEYGAALSDELQEELLSYFEEGAINREEALEAQQKIAAFYTSRSDLSFSDFAQAVRSLGYDISRESVHTSYIIDDKKSKENHGGEYTTGNITVFSIKNKDGETLFKIADTNGNAAIEVEELFMNELLSGISNKIDKEKFESTAATAGSFSSHSSSSEQVLFNNAANNNINKTSEETKEKDGKHVITQAQYDKLTNEKIELLINQGYEKSEAKAEAKKFMDKNYTIDNSSTNKAVKVAGFYTSSAHINNSNNKELNEEETISEQEIKEIIKEEEAEELIA